jgi:hypothetical protein
MFINLNHLNEGNSVKNTGDEQKKQFSEGENPKAEKTKESGLSWLGARTQTHVNRNWAKLRM